MSPVVDLNGEVVHPGDLVRPAFVDDTRVGIVLSISTRDIIFSTYVMWGENSKRRFETFNPGALLLLTASRGRT